MEIQELYSEFKRPTVAVDSVILRTKELATDNKREVPDRKMQVLLIKNKNEKNWELPGTMMHIDETADNTLNRLSKEKINAENISFEQLYTVTEDLFRDPRGRVISIVYIGMTNTDIAEQINGYDKKWFWINKPNKDKQRKLVAVTGEEEIYNLNYDHTKILHDAICRIQNKLMYTDIGFSFIEKIFTIKELEKTFTAINERQIPGFRRIISTKVLGTEIMSSGKAFRPAELYIKKG